VKDNVFPPKVTSLQQLEGRIFGTTPTVTQDTLGRMWLQPNSRLQQAKNGANNQVKNYT